MPSNKRKADMDPVRSMPSYLVVKAASGVEGYAVVHRLSNEQVGPLMSPVRAREYALSLNQRSTAA